MFDTAQFRVDACMHSKFMHEAYKIIMPLIGAHDRPKADPILGEWLLSADKIRPHQQYGYSLVWNATHRQTGVVVAFVGERLISFSASLPRLLHGKNVHELKSQADVDAALAILIETVSRIAHIEDVLAHVKLGRIDLVAYTDIPLSDIKRCLLHARHLCSKFEPTIHPNSIYFDGDVVGVFMYDKERKERLPNPGKRTRVEIRLKGKDAMERYPQIFAAGPRLDFEEAIKVYLAILGQFPNEGKITQVPRQSLYHFLAWTESVVPADFTPRPVAVYCSMMCAHKESAERARRFVANLTPSILNVRLADKLSIPRASLPTGVQRPWWERRNPKPLTS